MSDANANPDQTSSESSKIAALKAKLKSHPDNAQSKPFREKVKTGLAVVGVISIAGVAAGVLANKKQATIEVSAPSVDVSTTETSEN